LGGRRWRDRHFRPTGSLLSDTATGATRSRPHGRARPQNHPYQRPEHVESRMQWKLHVRFRGRAGETHQSKGGQGAPVRPLHLHPDVGRVGYLATVLDVFSRRIPIRTVCLRRWAPIWGATYQALRPRADRLRGPRLWGRSVVPQRQTLRRYASAGRFVC
jgi:hypothetical protein